jgi:hypothetical protein
MVAQYLNYLYAAPLKTLRTAMVFYFVFVRRGFRLDLLFFVAFVAGIQR